MERHTQGAKNEADGDRSTGTAIRLNTSYDFFMGGFNMTRCSDLFRRFVCTQSSELIFTAEVEQVCEEEGLFVEVFYGHHYGSIQTAAKSLLRPTFICYQ